MLSLAVPAAAVEPSPRVVEVCLRFGLEMRVGERCLVEALRLALAPGTVTLVRGPSGAGKSLLLRQLCRQVPLAREVGAIAFPEDVAVVDAVLPTREVAEAMALLTACGLGEPRLWLQRFGSLSEGERFRVKLARAVGMLRLDRLRREAAEETAEEVHGGGPAGRAPGGEGPHRPALGGMLVCDDFGASLHGRLARAVGWNLRKLAARERLAVVVATTREDLAADVVVRLGGGEAKAEFSSGEEDCAGRAMTPVEQRCHTAGGANWLRHSSALPAPPVFEGQLRIEPGKLRDYAPLAALHYRSDRLGFIDKVFVCRDDTGQVLGAVVYGRPVLELSQRNLATGGRFVRHPRRLNAEMRVLKRLVVHPDVRGCGVGAWLVRRTLPEAGTRFVECLAALGAVHPVFERAGMRRIGVGRDGEDVQQAMAELEQLGVDPWSAEFPEEVRRKPGLRRLVAATVAGWYRATTGGGEARIGRQSLSVLVGTFRQLVGSRPVYYLWEREGEKCRVLRSEC